MSSTATRKPKWHPAPPPPPTPRILNLPRRNHRRRRTCRTAAAASSSSYGERTLIVHGMDMEEKQRDNYRGKLESFFDGERKFADNFIVQVGDRKEKAERSGSGSGSGFTEEKWRFQAEILRAECNFLRMEREIALKKLERNKTQMEITLRSAVEGLVSGRKKIHEGKNKNVTDVLEEEIEYLEEMLGELQSQGGSYAAAKDLKVKKCSNFDRKAALLRRRLDDDQKRSADKKIQLPTTGEKKSASNENPILIPASLPNSECSGRCQSIVKRIVEQVRAETEQWSQMQEMVGRVRDEMEELQVCREFWEDRALDSEFETRSLRCLVQEWSQKAMSFEAKAKDLETEVSSLREKLKKKNKERNDIAPPIAAAVAAEEEKKKLVLKVKPRLPFRDIGNSLSPSKMNQSSKGIFPFNFPHNCSTEKPF